MVQSGIDSLPEGTELMEAREAEETLMSGIYTHFCSDK